MKEIKAFALTKKFLLKTIFPKYPDIANQIKAEALLRYRRNIHKPIVNYYLILLSYDFRMTIEEKSWLTLTKRVLIRPLT